VQPKTGELLADHAAPDIDVFADDLRGLVALERRRPLAAAIDNDDVAGRSGIGIPPGPAR